MHLSIHFEGKLLIYKINPLLNSSHSLIAYNMKIVLSKIFLYYVLLISFRSNQFSSVAQSCLTLCDPMNHITPDLPVHRQIWSPTKPMSIESVMPSNHLILCHPLILLPSIFPCIRVFSNESALYIRWPKYWSCSFNITPSNETQG